MRGFPLLNVLAVTLFLAALATPLVYMSSGTRTASRGSVTVPAGKSDLAMQVPGVILLRLVHEPVEIALQVNGQPVAVTGQGMERVIRIPLVLQDQALEIQIRARWADPATPGMVEVRVAPDGFPELLQNGWADQGVLEEQLRFDWRKPG